MNIDLKQILYLNEKTHHRSGGPSLNRLIYKHIHAQDNLPFLGSPSWDSLQGRLFYDVPSWLFLLHLQRQSWKAMIWPEEKKINFSSL
jgi:hypothetical protein